MTNIKEALKHPKKLVFGKEQIFKQLRAGKIQEIMITSNYPAESEIQNLAKLSDAKITRIKQTNDELGALCKKPYRMALIGLKKD